MRNWELIKQSQLLKIESQILSNLFNEKYRLRLGEFNNTTGTERVNNTYVGESCHLEAPKIFIDAFYYNEAAIRGC